MILKGSPYAYNQRRVMAMETTEGQTVRVREFDENEPMGLRTPMTVPTAQLKPLGVRYYGGEARG